MKESPDIQVVFRKAPPLSDSKCRYPGFSPGTSLLPKGSVHRKDALPLPCDITFERDVAVPMRDGAITYVDIFRPANEMKAPAIIAWSPYGKKGGYQTLDRFPGRLGIPVSALSDLQVWEGPDPAYWCNHRYAVVNADARGAFMSQGDIFQWGSQDGNDGYDLIEWLAGREWCNGKVGMSGNSWLAVSQWFIASKQPPHLAAIAPWEGLTDFYRDHLARGGIPDTGFNTSIQEILFGNNGLEDTSAMMDKYPLMNSYWQDKAAKLKNIQVPAYVVASYTSPVHTEGTIRGFRCIASKDKWLRIHNTQEWPDYYVPAHRDDLQRFFDRFLKDIQNDWDKTPRVRMSVLDPGGKDVVNRSENEFPLARTEYKELFLDASTGKLSTQKLTKETHIRYKADDGRGMVTFTMRFDQETELTGYMKLRLWVEAIGSEDMDLFVFIQKLDKKGKLLRHTVLPPSLLVTFLKIIHSLKIKRLNAFFYSGPKGLLRVSHRQLDPERSTPYEPYRTHTCAEPLISGQIVPVEIPICPASLRFHPGQQLRVVVAGYDLFAPILPELPVAPTRNKGEHIIHTGGRYDSYLQIPVIPPRYVAGDNVCR